MARRLGHSAGRALPVLGGDPGVRRSTPRDVPHRPAVGYGAARVGRLLLRHARRDPLAVRRTPERRRPDLQARFHPAARRGGRAPPAHRAGRSAARSCPPARASGATESAGSLAPPVSRTVPGPDRRSTAVSGCSPPSLTSASERCRSRTSAPSSPSKPRRSRPEFAAKTVNNALVTIVVCLNAVEDGLIVWTAPPSCVIGRSRPSRTLRRATCRCTPFDTWPRRLRRSPNGPGCAWRRARA